ncbi:hypothetical protein C0J52_21158 [Blattella germanica]|nr:hypothetical protein C0J52_21158 [Blattella germanica]
MYPLDSQLPDRVGACNASNIIHSPSVYRQRRYRQRPALRQPASGRADLSQLSPSQRPGGSSRRADPTAASLRADPTTADPHRRTRALLTACLLTHTARQRPADLNKPGVSIKTNPYLTNCRSFLLSAPSCVPSQYTVRAPPCLF